MWKITQPFVNLDISTSITLPNGIRIREVSGFVVRSDVPEGYTHAVLDQKGYLKLQDGEPFWATPGVDINKELTVARTIPAPVTEQGKRYGFLAAFTDGAWVIIVRTCHAFEVQPPDGNADNLVRELAGPVTLTSVENHPQFLGLNANRPSPAIHSRVGAFTPEFNAGDAWRGRPCGVLVYRELCPGSAIKKEDCLASLNYVALWQEEYLSRKPPAIERGEEPLGALPVAWGVFCDEEGVVTRVDPSKITANSLQPDTEESQAASDEDKRNPKDAAGRAKVPMHLFSGIGIAYGSLGILEGMLKYGYNNFRATEVYATVYIAAAMRHLEDYLEGNDLTKDTGIPNLSGVLANVDILLEAYHAGTLIDDRKWPGERPGGAHRHAMETLTPYVKKIHDQFGDRDPKHYDKRLWDEEHGGE